jgi:adenylate kinase
MEMCSQVRWDVIRITAPSGGGPYSQPMTVPDKPSRASWLQGPSARCENIPKGACLPWRIILLGAPGVGKGTQADLLNQRLLACHLSTGDVFREATSRRDDEQTPAMQEALAYMRRGELVPDATVWAMVRERGECLHCAGGFILDGFPRTLAQAVSLQQFMDKDGLPLTAVVSYELPTSEIVARLGGRRTCEKCKAVYHVTERPPRVEGRCDRCDGNLFQREDDRPESIKVRLDAYDRSTAPLIDFYRRAGLLLQVSAAGTPEEVCHRTIPELEARRLSLFAEQMWAAEENRRDT